MAATGTPAASRRGHGTVLVALVVTLTSALPAFLTGALGVELRADLGLSVTQLGAGVSAYFGASALCSAPLGRLGQRLGAVTAVRLSALATAAGMVSIGTWVQSFTALLGCLAVAGAANALGQPTMNAFLTRGIAPGRLGLAFGIKQAGIPLTVFVSGVSLPALALTVGWRAVFLAAAGIALAVALGVGQVVRGTGTERRRAGRPETSPHLLIVLAALAAAAALVGNATGAFLVSAAVASGWAQGAAGALLAAASLVSVLVRVSAGGLIDRSGGEGLRGVALLLSAGVLGFVALATSLPALFVVGALLAFGGGWAWPGLFNFAVVTRNPNAPAAATGVTQTGVYVGAAAGPVSFGALAGAVSYDAAWALLAALALLAATLAVIARRALGSERPAVSPAEA
jgi:MFS family permease